MDVCDDCWAKGHCNSDREDCEAAAIKMGKMEPHKCNLCGESTRVGDCVPEGGLIRAVISGGFDSTPGNGHGALDDGTTYTFSLCEFCCDWLMSQFKIPPKLGYYMGGPSAGEEPEKWIPAAGRVLNDDWRGMKKEFFAEQQRRSLLRGKR